MKVEATNALRFILQDEIYLLNGDKTPYAGSSTEPPVVETKQPVFNYLGSNKKHFLVLVNYTDHEFIKEEHLAALESVLSRLGHTREDVAIVNLANYDPAEHEQLLAYFEPKTIVILGKQAIPTGMPALRFNIIERKGGISLLHTFGFDEMMTSIENKKAFWEQIKNL